MINITEETRKELSEIVNNAEVLFLFTGAGMGVDSGLKTFRDNDGLWSSFPDLKKINLSFKEIANPKNYEKHTKIAMNFYRERLKKYQNISPHDGFYQLLNYGKSLKKGFFSITSNVDGHFFKAGYPKNSVYEIHGNLNNWQCSSYNCSRKRGIDALQKPIIRKDDNILNLELWCCSSCSTPLRPNICMFDDFDWFSEPYSFQSSAFSAFKYNNEFAKSIVIEIGAGDIISSIRRSSELVAFQFKTKVIRINTNITEDDLKDPNIISIPLSAKNGIEFLMSLKYN